MPTAAAMMTRFMRMRRLMFMPERKASSMDTGMMTLPAVMSENSASVAPKSTGSKGDHRPGKVTDSDDHGRRERIVLWRVPRDCFVKGFRQ